MRLKFSHTVHLVLGTLLTSTGSGAFGQVVNEDFKLIAEDTEFGDQLGWSIDVDDGIIAISTYTSNNDYNNMSGKAYLFDASTGEQLHKLQPSSGHIGDGFGWAIAINDGIVAVGASGDDSIDTDAGAVYLFDAATGNQLHRIYADDPVSYSYLGISVAIDDGVVAVGAPYHYDETTKLFGAVYLFDVTTGTQMSKIVAEDNTSFEEFGFRVAIDDGILAITNHDDSDNGPQSGSAYLFDVETGTQIVKFYPDNPKPNTYFGQSVDINNGFVAVENYLFDTAGNQLMKLHPEYWPNSQEFGGSPAMSDGMITISTPSGMDNGENSGSAYIFAISTGEQIATLIPEFGKEFGFFGSSVAMDRGTVAVGAVFTDDTGAGYAFNISGTICPADLTQDGSVDFFDISEFLSTQPDWNGDTVFDFFDVSDYLAAFTAGCP